MALEKLRDTWEGILNPVLESLSGVKPSTETWVALPEEAWPEEWKSKYHCPTVRLQKALYGHPDSRSDWDQHCDKALREVGFTPITDWPSRYFHPTLNLL